MTFIEFADGFVKDDFAKKCNAIQVMDFLYTEKRPKLGQRLEIQVSFSNNRWCRLSGIVTEIGNLPTYDEWIVATSTVPVPPCRRGEIPADARIRFPRDCPYPNCSTCILRQGETEMTLGTLMNRCFKHMGTLQNQTLAGFAYLNFDFHDNQVGLPISKGNIYKVTLHADDSKECMWMLDSIENVTESVPFNELPQEFRDWKMGHETMGNN
jgi:hypothetical protein